jgi:2-keto-3-deoxy-L-rhamnonate aldolase RhmA
MLVNKTKQKLRDGKPVFGVQTQFDDPFITEIIGAAGFDFILIDAQHSPIGEEKIFAMTRGFAPTESDVIVRVVWNETWLINQALDMGADGVIIPLPNTADDVKRAVEAAKFPPMGVRSNGPRKTAHLGGFGEYQARANEETIVWPQIETKEALDNIDEILRVEGIDGIMVGPSDLAYSLGLQPPDLLGHPKAEEAIQFILDKCNEHGVPWGMFTSPIEMAEKWLRRGGKIVTAGSDFGFVQEGADAAVKRASEVIASL